MLFPIIPAILLLFIFSCRHSLTFKTQQTSVTRKRFSLTKFFLVSESDPARTTSTAPRLTPVCFTALSARPTDHLSSLNSLRRSPSVSRGQKLFRFHSRPLSSQDSLTPRRLYTSLHCGPLHQSRDENHHRESKISRNPRRKSRRFSVLLWEF